MTLFEKYFRSSMPQIKGADLSNAQSLFDRFGIETDFVDVRVGDLGHMQHDSDINDEKVNSIADEVQTNGVGSMPPLVISGDQKVLDGHHRQCGIEKACGPDEVISCFCIKQAAEMALQALSKVTSMMGESLSLNLEVIFLSGLHGQFTESALLSRGVSKAAIRRAVSLRILESHKFHYQTVQLRLREARLQELLPATAALGTVAQLGVNKLQKNTKEIAVQAGQVVSRIVNGQLKKYRVTDNKNGVIHAVDIDDGKTVEQIPEKDVAPADDAEETDEEKKDNEGHGLL